MESLTPWRPSAISALSGEAFDLAIIGGGITGAGVAREAALGGLRVALLERDDFAAGTSSRSSRLIHGGVRYLEYGYLGLVFEASRERRLLLTLAPHLVRPLAFTWPVYRGARIPRWKLRAGLTLYDSLALFQNVHRHTALDKRGVLASEPGLDPNALLGGARYWDAATDDSRLTVTNALAAADAGAVMLNHCSVIGSTHNGTHISGVVARDELSNQEFHVKARVVLNATGPWSDATAALTGESDGNQVLGSAGTHVLVPRQRIGNRDAITLLSPLDGRVMFVLPAGAFSIIGTTERPANSGPDQIRPTIADVTYLLQSVNRLFPFAQLSPEDVISAWAGIRPLARTRAGEHSAGSASREHAITRRADGLLSVTGGKLTTYRSMAEDIVSHVWQEIQTLPPAISNRPSQRLVTAVAASRVTPLPGGDIVALESVAADASTTVHDVAVGERMAHAYGSRWRNVWSYVQRDPLLGARLIEGLPYLTAEVAHAVEREWACTISDVLIRRTHLAFEVRDHGRATARRIAPLMQTLLNWSEAERERQIEAYDADVARIFSIEGADGM